jgi:hypothetical protein
MNPIFNPTQRSMDYLGFGVGYGVKWDASFGLPLPVVAKAESLRLA